MLLPPFKVSEKLRGPNFLKVALHKGVLTQFSLICNAMLFIQKLSFGHRIAIIIAGLIRKRNHETNSKLTFLNFSTA